MARASDGTKNDAWPPIHLNLDPRPSSSHPRMPDVEDSNHGGSRRYVKAATRTLATAIRAHARRRNVSAIGETLHDIDPTSCRCRAGRGSNTAASGRD